MASAIVNSSPLIHLGDIGRIDLLRSLFEAVAIPGVVAEEIRAKDEPEKQITCAGWQLIAVSMQ